MDWGPHGGTERAVLEGKKAAQSPGLWSMRSPLGGSASARPQWLCAGSLPLTPSPPLPLLSLLFSPR